MDENCAVYQTADFIGKKWTLLILLELYRNNKEKRFSEIKNSLPHITPKILSARLKELESLGLVSNKIDHDSIPIKSFYSLTKSGTEFIKVIKEIKKWALKWREKNKVCENTNCKNCDV